MILWDDSVSGDFSVYMKIWERYGRGVRRKTYGHFEGFGYIIAPIKRNNKNEEKRNDKDQNKICTEPYRKNACG